MGGDQGGEGEEVKLKGGGVEEMKKQQKGGMRKIPSGTRSDP